MRCRPPSSTSLAAQYRPRRSSTPKGISMSPKSQDIKQFGLFGFLAQPDAPTKSGVVILPTIFGVNAFVRGYAETLARAGLAAAVWDPYEGLPLITDYEESKKRSRKLSDSGMQANVKKWVDYLENDLRLTSIGVVGFCLGGRYALIAATQERRMKACAAAYPSIENPRLSNQEYDAVALAADIRCPSRSFNPATITSQRSKLTARSGRRCTSARPRRSGSIIPTPSTASCIARSRPPILQPQ